MLVKGEPRVGDYVVASRLGAVRVGKVVKVYQGKLGRLFVGLATENPYPTADDIAMDNIIRRNFPHARPRVTYRPFLPLYGWKGRAMLLLGPPRLRVFTTRQEAYGMVYDFVDTVRQQRGFYASLRVKSVLRR